MNEKTIILVLRSGGKFEFRDLELLSSHINNKFPDIKVICLFDLINKECQLNGVHLIPIKHQWEGWWSKLNLFSPELEKYRPFLYLDLDTAVVGDLEQVFPSIELSEKFIALEDFYQKGKLASGLLWVPKNSKEVQRIWKYALKKTNESKRQRMDKFLREISSQDLFFQDYTDSIYTFKPKFNGFLKELPENASIICFHGKPGINDVSDIDWLNKYKQIA